MKHKLYDGGLTKWPSWQIVQVYDMTEASPYVAYQKLGTVEHLLPNISAMLKVEIQSKMPRKEGPNVLGTRLKRLTYNTGNVCTISKPWILSIVGRTKELIKYKSFQMAPAELKAHLNSHPYVVKAGIG